MLTTHQSLDSVTENLETLLRTNKNRSLSGVYKALRRQKKINLIGNYLLLAFILSYGYHRAKKYTWNRVQIVRAIKISNIWKEEHKKYARVPQEWLKYIKK